MGSIDNFMAEPAAHCMKHRGPVLHIHCSHEVGFEQQDKCERCLSGLITVVLFLQYDVSHGL